MSKRITIQAGDFILLTDIPNEQAFNLVKECFRNAGFPSESSFTEFYDWVAFMAFNSMRSKYTCLVMKSDESCQRQLSLSDVFNSTNGGFDWGSSDVALFATNWTDATRTTRNYITIERIVEQPTMSYATPDTYKISRLCDLNSLERTDVKLIEGRAIGKSTAHYLELISKAMKSPEQWVKVYSDYDNLERHNRWAFEEVRNLCHKLGLDWMEFSVSGNSIRYMPYQTVKLVSRWERVE